jgi:hypothetical protein
MAAKKMGRPPKPKGEARGEILTLRLTAAERKAAEALARRERLAVSEWARRVLLAEIERDGEGSG